MSIAFHLLLSTFGGKPASEPAQYAPTQSDVKEGATSCAYGTTGQISAFPWEGLYLELPGESVEAVSTSSHDNHELERFLTALMIGE
jgi:hypothetical protein